MQNSEINEHFKAVEEVWYEENSDIAVAKANCFSAAERSSESIRNHYRCSK